MPRELSEKDRALYRYNAIDIDSQAVAMDGCQRWIDEDDVRATYEFDCRKTVVAREMRELGNFIDLKRKDELSRLLQIREDAERKRVCDIVGIENFNPGSRNQVGDWLFEKNGLTPVYRSGSSSEEWEEGDDAAVSIPAALALEEIVRATSSDENVLNFLDAFIMFKSAQKLRTANVDNIPLHACEFEGLGRIHPTFNTHVTPSGRFSHSKPNIAQWASRGIYNMDTMIVPPPGHVLVGADLDQVEVRLYTLESGDRLLRDVIDNGKDPHSLNYATMICKTEAAAWKLHDKLVKDKKSENKKTAADAKYLRTIAKRFAFLLFYGGGRDKLFATMRGDRNKETGKRSFADLSELECRGWYDRFVEFHPELKAWQESVIDELRAEGKVRERVNGRVRHFPNGAGGTDAMNHKIQGAAASLADNMLFAIVRDIPFGGWSKYTGVTIQRHDMIGAIVPCDKADLAIEIFRAHMNTVVDGMPITADIKSSKPWWPDRPHHEATVGTLAEV